MPIYEQLPEVAKKEILKKGEEKFKEEVTENKDKVSNQVMSQFNIENLSAFFSQINPENPLEGIVGNAFSFLTGNIGSSSGGGGIGGIIKGFF